MQCFYLRFHFGSRNTSPSWRPRVVSAASLRSARRVPPVRGVYREPWIRWCSSGTAWATQLEASPKPVDLPGRTMSGSSVDHVHFFFGSTRVPQF